VMRGDETIPLGERCFSQAQIDRSKRLLADARQNARPTKKKKAQLAN